MPTITCPQCEKQVDLAYGNGVPCPACGETLDVAVDEEHLPQKYEIKRESVAHYLTPNDSPPRSERRYTPSGSGSSDSSSVPRVTYRDIGGLDETISKLDLLVNGATRYPEVWKHTGKKKVRGILLYGPPGCGKTLLAQALASAGNRKCNVIQGSETNSWRVGDSEHNLINEYKKVAPDGIFIIDEIDAIGGKREAMNNETSRAVVDTLCSLLDGAKYKDRVIVIGTTNKPNLLDSALRRPGRFDVEMYVPPPNVNGRKHIFAIHTRGMPLAKDVDLDDLAAKAHGFSGADIMGVCSRMSEKLLATAVKELEHGVAQDKVISGLYVTHQQFLDQIGLTIPAVLREGFVPVSGIRWSQIGGLAEVKKELQQVVEWPIKYATLMHQLKLPQPKGMLLYGPPGCGKTLIAKAIAGESGCNLLVVNGPALVKNLLGDTEGAIRDIFWKARQAAPCIIFFDEIDSIAPVRGRSVSNDAMDRAVSQLLVEIDGVQTLSDVFVLAATNRPELVDPALLRPGRLELQCEIPLPDEDARKEIFAIHLNGVRVSDITAQQLAKLTSDYSGAKVELLCTTAKKYTLERYIASGDTEIPSITCADFTKALTEVSKRTY